MVVAGPGTGKTELLSVRVANILKKTDVLPGNILCLTFTDNAAANMRERLETLLGPDAYKVAIHTFHSFGSEVINQYGEYFYNGAQFRPADELSSYEIMNALLEPLPHDNPLSSKMNGRFVYLRDIQTSISELKRGGLSPQELERILDKNAAFITWLKPRLATVFKDRLSKKTLGLAQNLVEEMVTFSEEKSDLSLYHPLVTLLQQTLQSALDDAEAAGTTKPLTAWKSTFLEKDAHDKYTLKDERRGEKLKALCSLYEAYLRAMTEHELYDYDDMILRVIQALEENDDLRFTLQETYQYILIDEFQDTNDAQMRLVWNMTNNPVSEDRPNLMVVGDDDQAIYRFQGANLSNILDFTSRYRDVAVIPLTDNYRSDREILSLARNVITQADERLETSLAISKVLTPHHTAPKAEVAGTTYQTLPEAHASLAQRIAADMHKNPAESRAVIGRHYKELEALLPHLLAAKVPVRYERQDNALDAEPVRLLEQTAHVVWHLGRQEFEAANEHLPEVLAHPSWKIAPKDLWQLSLAAHRQKKFWLEVMLDSGGRLAEIAEWFIVGSSYAQSQPLEFMLDYIFGIAEGTGFASPYKAYFFDAGKNISAEYLSHLGALQKIRAGIREYRPGDILKLENFIEYLDLHHELELSLSVHTALESTNAVTLLSAHRSKGLEFDAVYITDAHESVWGSSARSRNRSLSFPSNLPLSPAGSTDDERLRLLYVALTRAKNQLVLVAADVNDNGKALLPAGAFAGILPFAEQPAMPIQELVAATETSWYAPFLNVSSSDQRTLLAPYLEHYKLSATHLNNYLDLTKGGPEYFLLHNLLQLPEAKSASAQYGSAIHAVLQRAHQHIAATGHKRPIEDVLRDFELSLKNAQLTELDFHKYLERGTKSLTAFLEKRYDSFTGTQQVERSFSKDYVVVGDAVLKGALDLIDIDKDEKTIFVTDYKTGKALSRWQGKTEFEKIKLHHYEQQLMMYKLLIEHSRQFAGYTVTGARIEFVEPDTRGEIVLLDYLYDSEKLAAFEKLVGAVWQRIQALDFSLPDDISPDFKGIVAFESSLI